MVAVLAAVCQGLTIVRIVKLSPRIGTSSLLLFHYLTGLVVSNYTVADYVDGNSTRTSSPSMSIILIATFAFGFGRSMSYLP